MPIYEYRCSKCRRRFEELVFSRNEKVICPRCGGEEVSREMSMFAYSCDGTFRSSMGSSCDSCKRPSCVGCKNAAATS